MWHAIYDDTCRIIMFHIRAIHVWNFLLEALWMILQYFFLETSSISWIILQYFFIETSKRKRLILLALAAIIHNNRENKSRRKNYQIMVVKIAFIQLSNNSFNHSGKFCSQGTFISALLLTLTLTLILTISYFFEILLRTG